jgi:hypothetical protein
LVAIDCWSLKVGRWLLVGNSRAIVALLLLVVMWLLSFHKR